MDWNPTQRFSSRVEDYIRYRPSYPLAIAGFLERVCRLRPASQIADIGSGTGLLAEVFLRHGCEVIGVEPNLEMRQAGDRLMAEFPRFRSVDGRAESTGLPDQSIDFVTAGQSFHWFQPEAARREFQRILRPSAWVVLVWNERLEAGDFLAGYEALLQRMAPDYAGVDHRQVNGRALDRFYGHAGWLQATFPNRQDFDWTGLLGRLHSSSYAPLPGAPAYEPMIADLKRLFETHQKAGQVSFFYDTKVYAGRLRARWES